ncbi:hypothetical protein N665_1965s0002 [Sinapis alba]|nr:hypothetical protein N665_1965s0002 [Sinapis alba]
MAMVRTKKNIVSFLRELKSRKDTSRIEVRIIRLWRNYNKESGNTIEVVFVDKEFPSEVPEKYFAEFTILEGNIDSSCLVDIIGQIVNFGFCSVKEWKGAYSISSGFNSTQIFLNPTLGLIEEFKAWYWSVGTATSVRARFFVLNERLTIKEIIDITLATIESIDTERGWQYLSCKYHNKKILPTTNVDADDCPLFFCNTCGKEHIDVISRFKLIVNVKDDSGEANFLLFDGNAQLVVRRPAAKLYDENEDEDLLPEAISDLFGKRILFEISVDADNIKGKSSQYVVRMATDDREMISEFAALPPKPVLMLQSSDDISTGSGGFSGTPLSKRKSEEDQESSLDDQHSVSKKLAQKKVKGE